MTGAGTERVDNGRRPAGPPAPRVSERELNRTLLQRQHLLSRVDVDPLDEIAHLVGLQAQETLPPYLSLFARLTAFSPASLSDAIGDGRVIRLLLMRGTIHAVSPLDAVTLRPLVNLMLDRASRTITNTKPSARVPTDELLAAGVLVFQGGPMGLEAAGNALAQRFPDFPAKSLANSLRYRMALVQVPPRGMWGRSGGVVYDTLENITGGSTPSASPDPRPIIRRYLAAFGPASAADFRTWSGVSGVASAIASMDDELVHYTDEHGRPLVDLPDLPIADADTPAPPRLFGRYDNVWLSHADRDRVTTPEARKLWAGTNGGVANTVFVDGHLAGLWRRAPSGAIDMDLFRRVSRAEKRELDAEVSAVQEFLAQ
jgi:prepilin-type processing-associated H-X9-DG protein